MTVALLHPKPDHIGECERSIAEAIETLEQRTGQQVALIDLLYCDENGGYSRMSGQTHRCVVVALSLLPDRLGVPWVRSVQSETA